MHRPVAGNQQHQQAMQLVLLTPPQINTAEPKLCNTLFASGLEVLHVRKPAAEVQELREYLQHIKPEYLQRVVLHQYHELADEFPLKGIHFKEKDRPNPPLPRLRPGLSQSTSLHTLEDVAHNWQNLDYAFLSPIFDSISKEGYAAAAFNSEALTASLSAASMPVYALGGILPNRLAAVQQIGFAGAGILGGVWAKDDPVVAFEEFLQAASSVTN